MQATEFMAALSDSQDMQRAGIEVECDQLVAGKARRFTRALLTEWGLDTFEDFTDRVLLAVSELATNTYKHARTVSEQEREKVDLTLLFCPGSALAVRMADNSPNLPVPGTPCLDASSGRGLLLLAAQADAWSTQPKTDGPGKQVWAFFRCPDASAQDRLPATVPAPRPTRTSRQRN